MKEGEISNHNFSGKEIKFMTSFHYFHKYAKLNWHALLLYCKYSLHSFGMQTNLLATIATPQSEKNHITSNDTLWSQAEDEHTTKIKIDGEKR